MRTDMQPILTPSSAPSATRAVAVTPVDAPRTPAGAVTAVDTQRVLRNTYGLLAMTLLFSGGVASAAVALKLPAPGLVLSLAGMFGLLFVVHRLRSSAWALAAVFGLTGLMGYTLAPALTAVLAVPGGGRTIALALGVTGAVFLALSAGILVTRRDFSGLGSFLFAGLVVALIASVAAVLFALPVLAVVVAAGVALIASGLILYETSRIVRGGETNYVLATVGLYASIFNLFASLLTLFGVGGSSD